MLPSHLQQSSSDKKKPNQQPQAPQAPSPASSPPGSPGSRSGAAGGGVSGNPETRLSPTRQQSKKQHLASSPVQPHRPLQRFDTPPLPGPPLGVTGVVCTTHQLPVVRRGVLHYTVFRPRLMMRGRGAGACGGIGRKTVVATASASASDSGGGGGGGMAAAAAAPPAPAPNLPCLPPLVCIAGGPLLPCQYLMPLVHVVTDRAVVLYDAIGCGQSPAAAATAATARTESTDGNNKSATAAASMVSNLVSDLDALIQHLPCQRFHLYGHSFGGIVAYEYLKGKKAQRMMMKQQQQETQQDGATEAAAAAATLHQQQRHCCSVILGSTPVSVEGAERSSRALFRAIMSEMGYDNGNDENDNHDDDDHVDDVDVDEEHVAEAQRLFLRRHECRVHPTPHPLEQALSAAGFRSSAAALRAVRGYRSEAAAAAAAAEKDGGDNDAADADSTTTTTLSTPALLLRGEHDFVTEQLLSPWQERVFVNRHTRTRVLAGCSHYGLLEDETLYGRAVSEFIQCHDSN